jgi:hypothetical protein
MIAENFGVMQNITIHIGAHPSGPKPKTQHDELRHTLFNQNRKHGYETDTLEREFQRREHTKDHKLGKMPQKIGYKHKFKK